jgi:hypothetical protein
MVAHFINYFNFCYRLIRNIQRGDSRGWVLGLFLFLDYGELELT